MYNAYRTSKHHRKSTHTTGGAIKRYEQLTDFIDLNQEIMLEYKKLITNSKVKVIDNRFTATIKSTQFDISSTLVGYDDAKQINRIICFYATWFASVNQAASLKRITICMYNIDIDKTIDVVPNKVSAYVLGEKHVNTGFTVFLEDVNAIYIYRNEEHLKVLLHELIHATRAEYIYFPDASQTNEVLRRVWGIPVPKVHEAICDAIAIMLYVYFKGHKGDAEQLAKYRKKSIEHAWKQAAAVYVLAGFSKWYGLDVRGDSNVTLANSDGTMKPNGIMFKYQQDSSVFEYYIIKAFLLESYPAGQATILTHHDIMRICCDQHNVKIFNKAILKAQESSATKISLRMTPEILGGKGRLQAKAKQHKAYKKYHNCIIAQL